MKIRHALLFPFAVIVALSLAGCLSIEQSAMELAAGAQGFIAQAQQNHADYCKANPAVEFPCQDLDRAVTAQNLLIDALETYCQWPVMPTDPTLACKPVASAKAGLTQAMTNLSAILADYKNLSGGKP